MASTTAAMPTKEEMQAALDDSKPRPKANVDAQTAAEVYPIDTLIGKDIMGMLNVKPWVEATEAKVPVKVASRFVAKRISALAARKDVRKLKVLKFVLLLVLFKDSLQKRGMKGPSKLPLREKLVEMLGEPAPLMDALKRKFAKEYVWPPPLPFQN